jgi:hypothetical protein
MGKKAETIRHALNHKGIPITDGIPEQIITELNDAGYVIKKSKKLRMKKNK